MPDKELEKLITLLVAELPRIVASEMNLVGRELHDGGVGENEILVDATEYSRFARNIKDIQITVTAHSFEERVSRLQEITDSIYVSVVNLYIKDEFCGDFDGLKTAVFVQLVEMGYTAG